MASDFLLSALLSEEAAPREALGTALFAALKSERALVLALSETHAVSEEVLARYLARSHAPFVNKVVPDPALLEQLPPGLCARLFAIPVRRDALTGTVDVVVADAGDPHPRVEMAFHLGAPVRLVRGSVTAIDDALRKVRRNSLGLAASNSATSPAPSLAQAREDEPRRPTTQTPHKWRETPAWGTPLRPSLLPPSRRSEPPVPPRVATHRAPALTSLRPSPRPSLLPVFPTAADVDSFAAFAPRVSLADTGGLLASVRAATSRDEVLELVLTSARMVAVRVALFVAKRGDYVGWACTPEFGDAGELRSIVVPGAITSAPRSLFDEAGDDGLYLGSLRLDDVHAPLLHVMRGASRDVAIVPIRVGAKTAVVIVADELGEPLLATRKLEELARAAGEALARLIRGRR